MKEFLKRLIVTIIGVPLAFYVIYLGGYIFFAVVCIFSFGALWEYYNLMKKMGIQIFFKTVLTLNFLFLIFSFIINYILNSYDKLWLIIGLLSVVAMISLSINIWNKQKSSILNFAGSVSGLVYITLPFIFLLFIRDLRLQNDNLIFLNNSLHLWNLNRYKLVIGIFLTVWISDTAAYLIGKAFGKHKLIPSVSPKKTWEGAIAGFVFGIPAAYVFFYLIFSALSPINSIIIGVIVGSIGQIGDLAESKIKRDAGVKDSSELIPGHGGILDRFDSLLFVFPAIGIFLILISIFGISW